MYIFYVWLWNTINSNLGRGRGVGMLCKYTHKVQFKPSFHRSLVSWAISLLYFATSLFLWIIRPKFQGLNNHLLNENYSVPPDLQSHLILGRRLRIYVFSQYASCRVLITEPIWETVLYNNNYISSEWDNEFQCVAIASYK